MSTPRIKDASFLQLHIEKLILAAGVLVFAVSVFLFVIGNPFAIEINRQSYDKPADAVDVLVRIDDQLERGLQEPRPLPPVITPKFQEDFIAMMQNTVNLTGMVARVSNPGLTIPAVYPDIPEPSRYALVYPPAPKNIKHVTGVDVLDKEFDPKATQTYYTLWGKQPDEPGDFTMFIASGEFDIWEWVSRLKADPKAEDAIKIPVGIWSQRFGIAGVALLREEWDPEQGIWTDRQIVVPMPGQTRLLPTDKAEAETTVALTQINMLREGQLELAQPELPWLDGFVQAVPPGDVRDGRGAEGFLQAIDDENLGPSEKEIRKLEEKIAQLEARRAARENRGGAGPGATGPAAGLDDFGGDFDGPATGPSSDRRDPIQRQIDALRERIERLRPQATREEENRRKLAEARRLREEERARRDALRLERDRDQFGGPGDEFSTGGGIPGMELKEGATLRVWAADPSMQPGKTYRYKLLVSVINPLYAVPRLAPDQLEENRHRAALLPTEAEIDAMPWIGPIKVEPRSRFFFTSGGESRARVEIYRRYKGELKVQEFDGAPGDSIGGIMDVPSELGPTQKIDMSVGAILVDVEKRRDVFTGSTVYTMIYADENGQIYERVDALDKSSPLRKDVRDEIENGPEQALRPDPEANPGNEFGPGGGFGPGFNDF